MKGRRWSADNPNFDNKIRKGRLCILGCCLFCGQRIRIPLNIVRHICFQKKKYLNKNKKEMPKPKYY